MRLYLNKPFIVALILAGQICFAQIAQRDRDLNALISKMYSLPDVVDKLYVLDSIAVSHYNVDSTAKYAQLELDLSQKLNELLYKERALRFLGWTAYYNNDYAKTVKFALEAMVIADSIGDKDGMAHCYSDLANSYAMMQNASKANEYYVKAMELFKEQNDMSALSDLLKNIGEGNIHFELFDVAEKYYYEALEIDESRKMYGLVAEDYYGLGLTAYQHFLSDLYTNPNPKLLSLAKSRLEKSLELSKEYSNITNLYSTEYWLTSVKLNDLDFKNYKPGRREEILDSCDRMLAESRHLINTLDYDSENIDVGLVEIQYLTVKGEIGKAKALLDSLDCLIMGNIDFYADRTIMLYQTGIYFCRKTNDNLGAFRYLSFLRDAEKKYKRVDHAVEAAQDMVKSEFDQTIRNKEIEHGKRVAVSQLVGLCVFIILVIAISATVIIARISLKRKKVNRELDIKNHELELQREEMIAQNEYLEEQKGKIESQNKDLEQRNEVIGKVNKELTYSINYASVIQKSVFPSDSMMNSVVGDNILLFKPLRPVSGDFYWVSQIGRLKLLAVGDCTGYGVPAAFLSILGVSLLESVVAKYEENEDAMEAGSVLNELRTNFKKALNQKKFDSDNTAGIDMALIILDTERMTMHFAGAYRPVLVMRGDEAIKVDGDRMPIGASIKEEHRFFDHKMEMEDGDVIYLYTNGITDQFGYDEKNKVSKFGSKRLRETLLELHKLPFPSQKSRLELMMDSWRHERVPVTGNVCEQADDMLLLGIRL